MGEHAAARAGESGIRPEIVARASEWVVLLWSGEATPREQEACHRWRQAHPDHELAFQRMQGFGNDLQDVPAPVVYGSLQLALRRPNSRRKMLGALAVGAVGGSLLWQGSHSGPWLRLASDLSTPVGQWRRVQLEDGSQLFLNTDTVVDLAFDDTQRRIILQRGEVYLQSHPDSHQPARPLSIQTPQGLAVALGTRYTVRVLDGVSRVAVYDGTVDVRPRQGGSYRLPAGQGAGFSSLAVQQTYAVNDADLAWTRGQIVAEGKRLADFVAEVARYRQGWLSCAPEVADLRFTGVFPLDDTDFILDALEQGLPVKIRRRSGFWVTVLAR